MTDAQRLRDIASIVASDGGAIGADLHAIAERLEMCVAPPGSPPVCLRCSRPGHPYTWVADGRVVAGCILCVTEAEKDHIARDSDTGDWTALAHAYRTERAAREQAEAYVARLRALLVEARDELQVPENPHRDEDGGDCHACNIMRRADDALTATPAESVAELARVRADLADARQIIADRDCAAEAKMRELQERVMALTAPSAAELAALRRVADCAREVLAAIERGGIRVDQAPPHFHRLREALAALDAAREKR